MANDHVASPIRDTLNAFAGLPPFKEGDTVRIKGENHLGLHRVESCEWFYRTSPGVMPYWLVECSEIRGPIDWSKIPDGATGIITHSGWRGSATHLERASEGGDIAAIEAALASAPAKPEQQSKIRSLQYYDNSHWVVLHRYPEHFGWTAKRQFNPDPNVVRLEEILESRARYAEMLRPAKPEQAGRDDVLADKPRPRMTSPAPEHDDGR